MSLRTVRHYHDVGLLRIETDDVALFLRDVRHVVGAVLAIFDTHREAERSGRQIDETAPARGQAAAG